MTVQGGSGFEHGATPTTNGGGLADIITGSPAIISSNAHTGSRALQLNTSAAIIRYGKNLPSAQNVLVYSFYLKFDTLPGADADLFYMTFTDGGIVFLRFYSADNKIGFRSSGNDNAKSANAVSAGTYYRIDLRCTANTDPRTVEWKLNKTNQTSYSSAGTGSTVANWRFGTNTAHTYNIYIDDYDFSFDSGDYPIGGGNETGHEALVGVSDGTNVPGTNVMEDNAGTDIGATAAYDKVNSIPPSATTYVRQVSAGTGNYAEVQFGNITATHNGIICACILLAYTSETTSSNTAGCIVSKDDFASQTVVHGVAGALVDYSDGSTSSLYYKFVMIAGAVDDTTVNAIEARMGYAGDANPDPYWIDLIVEVGYSYSAGLSATVNQTTETDTAQAISKAKLRSVGQPAETDFAQIITRIHRYTIGQVTEADSVQAIAYSKSRTLGQPTEVDTSQAVTGLKVKGILQTAEVDSAQSVSLRRTYAVAQAVETNAAQALTRLKTLGILQATEIDAAQIITSQGDTVVPIGQTTETDSALATSVDKVKAILQAVEADSVQAIARSKTLALLQAMEVDSAQAFSRLKVKAVLQTAEVDAAHSVTLSSANIVQQATETDSAQSLSVLKQKAILQAAESNLAQPVSRIRSRLILAAMESDLSQVVVSLKARQLGQVQETDTSIALVAVRVVPVLQASEVDAAFAVAHLKRLVVQQAIEIDTAFAIVLTGAILGPGNTAILLASRRTTKQAEPREVLLVHRRKNVVYGDE